MYTKTQIPTVLTLLAIGSLPALAVGDGSVIDADGDGRYSLQELREIYPRLSDTAFAEIDVNDDGLVSPGEFRLGQDMGLLPAPGG